MSNIICTLGILEAHLGSIFDIFDDFADETGSRMSRESFLRFIAETGIFSSQDFNKLSVGR
jgi:hypothetical protein